MPDASDRARWAAFAQHLRTLGLTRDFTLERQQASERFPASFRGDWLANSYRRDSSPAAVVLRLLAFDRPVTQAESIAALGAAWFEFVVGTGLVSEVAGGWLSPFQLQLVNELYLFSDRPGMNPDAVMALGPTTELLARAAYPQSDIECALDLGCGCGVLALLLARAATRVVGTDLNPRAVAMAKLNAALNGLQNVSFREADLFGSVQGERFDLIVSQPPFLGCPDNEAAVLFLHGGRRGDELTLRIVQELPAYLTEQGTAFVLADFGLGVDETVSARIPQNGGAGVTVLVAGTPVDLEVNAALYVANGQLLSGEPLWQQTERNVAHARACGIDHLRPALIVVKAGTSGIKELAVAPDKWSGLERSLIDPLVAAARARDEPWQAWLPRRLRIADGTITHREQALAAPEKVRISLKSGYGSLLADPVVGESVLPLIAAVHEAGCVADALQGMPPERAVPILAQLVLHGILRVS